MNCSYVLQIDPVRAKHGGLSSRLELVFYYVCIHTAATVPSSSSVGMGAR
jgi:hypothetical protein